MPSSYANWIKRPEQSSTYRHCVVSNRLRRCHFTVRGKLLETCFSRYSSQNLVCFRFNRKMEFYLFFEGFGRRRTGCASIELRSRSCRDGHAESDCGSNMGCNFGGKFEKQHPTLTKRNRRPSCTCFGFKSIQIGCSRWLLWPPGWMK